MYNQARLGGSGCILPQEILEIRCPEIASEAILGQKQSHSSSVHYMARRILYQTFGCPCMHMLSQLTRERRLTEQQVG